MATLKQLHTFLTVAETLQMSEAAKRLYVSQPTVSQTILELEREFDATLFERTPRYLKLTAKGSLLWEYARQVADSYALLDQNMKHMPSTRELRIGATITIGNTLLPEIASSLKRSQPDICQHLYVENTQALENRLLRGEIDIALIEGVVLSDTIVKLPFAEDALEVICAKGHPLYGKKQIRAEELCGQGFILREQGSGTRIIFENYMRAARIPIRVVGESTSSTAIIEMVMSGLGLGVLSRRCVQRYTSKNLICACTIQGMPMSRYFYICYQTGHPITSQMADFIRVSQQSVQMTSFLSQEGACNETMATF